MQVKTIEKIIKTKMNSWLESIDDLDLRKEVRNSILVSGGSICSLLSNIEVNDYDVYIKDMNVLLKLANYYTKDYSDIEVLDGRERDGKYAEDLNRGGLRGITVRNLKPNQVKLYFTSKNGGIRVNENIPEEQKNYNPLFFSPNAISLSNDVQIVTRFSGTVEEIHKTFDFIHATNYFTFEEGLVTNTKALESILAKQLYYQGSMYPVTSLIRIKKFLKRNWNISAGEILKIAFDVSLLDLKNPDVLEEQLIGVDVAYFGALLDAIRNKIAKPEEGFNFTAEYLKTLIDKIFREEE